MNIVARITPDHQADELDRMQSGCDQCCSIPAVTERLGDQLCQGCADKFDAQPEDDLLPLDHPVMREASARWRKLYEGHRAYDRSNLK